MWASGPIRSSKASWCSTRSPRSKGACRSSRARSSSARSASPVRPAARRTRRARKSASTRSRRGSATSKVQHPHGGRFGLPPRGARHHRPELRWTEKKPLALREGGKTPASTNREGSHAARRPRSRGAADVSAQFDGNEDLAVLALDEERRALARLRDVLAKRFQGRHRHAIEGKHD